MPVVPAARSPTVEPSSSSKLSKAEAKAAKEEQKKQDKLTKAAQKASESLLAAATKNLPVVRQTEERLRKAVSQAEVALEETAAHSSSRSSSSSTRLKRLSAKRLPAAGR